MSDNQYLTLIEIAEQSHLKRKGCASFDYTVDVTSPLGAEFNIKGQLYANNELHAETIRQRISYRFVKALETDLSDKSFGFMFPRENRMKIRDFLTFRMDKNPVVRRSLKRAMAPSGIKIGDLTKSAFASFKAAKLREKLTEAKMIPHAEAARLRRNIAVHIFLHSIGTSIAVAILLSTIINFNRLTMYIAGIRLLFSAGVVIVTTLAIVTAFVDYKKLSRSLEP